MTPDEISQTKMFGETLEQMQAAKPEELDNLMYATMILSDAQECGDAETSRQFINKAKYFISQERKPRQR